MTHETDVPAVAPRRDDTDLTNERFQAMTDTRLASSQAGVPGLRLSHPDAEPAAIAALMAPIANACNRADGMDQLTTIAELANWLTSAAGPHFDPVADVQLARVADEVVGYTWTDWVDTTDGTREYRLGGYVHPAWQRKGIGTLLLHWGEQHAREHLAANPTELPAVFGSWAAERRVAKLALLAGQGYQPVRWFFEMLRPTLGQIDVPPMPDGLEVRPLGDDRAMWRRLLDADSEAFKDHWGGFVADDAEFAEWTNSPTFEPSLFVIAWDGDEIAGAVENSIPREENTQFGRSRGWLDSVFVRRGWRRRGLGAALVGRALVVLRDAGMTEAMLGVDSDNPTGALGLYERAGFTVHTRSSAFRKPM